MKSYTFKGQMNLVRIADENKDKTGVVVLRGDAVWVGVNVKLLNFFDSLNNIKVCDIPICKDWGFEMGVDSKGKQHVSSDFSGDNTIWFSPYFRWLSLTNTNGNIRKVVGEIERAKTIYNKNLEVRVIQVD